MLFKPETSYSILSNVFSGVGDFNIVYTYILLWGDDKLVFLSLRFNRKKIPKILIVYLHLYQNVQKPYCKLF